MSVPYFTVSLALCATKVYLYQHLVRYIEIYIFVALRRHNNHEEYLNQIVDMKMLGQWLTF